MSAQKLVILASAGVISGSVAQARLASMQVPLASMIAANKLYGAVAGLAIAAVGWKIDHDGVGDFVEALGLGFGAAAALQ